MKKSDKHYFLPLILGLLVSVAITPVFATSVSYTGLNNIANDSLTVSHLPVHAFKAAGNTDLPLLIIVSGDGGWNSFTDGLAKTYANLGMDVAGIDALKYFWHKSDPRAASDDFASVIRYYTRTWHKKRVILLGYSFGADVTPFIFNEFSEDVRKMISLLVLMSPSHHASFEFQLTGWLKGDKNSPYQVVPEIKKIHTPEIVIIYGRDEKDNLKGDLSAGNVDFVEVDGGHHFNDDYRVLTSAVLDEVKRLNGKS